MSRARLALVAVAALIAVAGCGGSTPAASRKGPSLPRDFFGMNAQLVAQAAQTGNLAYADRQIGQLAQLGVGFVRSNLDWPSLEPSPPSGGHHVFDFSGLDGWVEILARQHLRWLPTVEGDPLPRWDAQRSALSACGANAPPTTAAYVALMRALAERYGRDGSFWRDHPDLPYEPIADYEVWNEPNFGNFWCPRPDPAAYARLYMAAHAAIHAVDRRARVLLGGLAYFTDNEAGPPAKMSFQTFLSTAVGSVPRFPREVDAVAVHPYGADPGAVTTALRDFRSALASNGFANTPMLADEVGWHTQGGVGLVSVPEAQRAADFTAVTPAIALSNCGVIGIAAHTWVTLERSPNSSEDWYGMADPVTGAPYPSAKAYGAQVRALESAGRISPVPSPACGDRGSGGG